MPHAELARPVRSRCTLLPSPHLLVFVALGGLVSGCGEGPADVEDVTTESASVEVSGTSRSYRLYVPPGVGTATGSHPLLILFHGATQSPGGVELMSWLYPQSAMHGILVAYPEADGDYWNTPNSPTAYWSVPDVPFVDALVEDVSQRYGVDPRRIYVAGFSNGAIFAQLLACTRGDRIAGLAVVGAGMSEDVTRSCPWRRPVPTVVFFGDADPQFFWDEGFAAAVGMLGGVGSAGWLAEANGCDPEAELVDLPTVHDDGTTVTLWNFQGCSDDSDVDFYRIVGGGHTWPGSPLNLDVGFGRKTHNLDASAVMVDFLLGHALPAAGGAR